MQHINEEYIMLSPSDEGYEVALKNYYIGKEQLDISLIYISLIGIIIASQLFDGMLSTTIIHLIEFAFVGIASFCFINIIRKRSFILYEGWSRVLILLICISLAQIMYNSPWNEMHGKDLFLYILGKQAILPYILPFFILFLPNRDHIARICSIFFWASLLTIPLWLLNSNDLIGETFEGERIGVYLPYFACFLLAYPCHLAKWKQLTLWGIWAVYLILMLMNARRNMIFTLSFYAFMVLYINIAKVIRNTAIRIFTNGIIFTLIGSIFLLNIGAFSGGIFERLNKRLNEDSRSGVELLFWADYMTSTPEEQAFGKGSSGTYYQKQVDKETGEVTTQRNIVETGYLDMMLKGGYTFAVIIVLLMITCLVKAYKSKEEDSVFLKLIYILFVIDCYAVVIVTQFCTFSIIFWLCTNLALNNNYLSFDTDSKELKEEAEEYTDSTNVVL